MNQDGLIEDNVLLWSSWAITEQQMLAIRDILRNDQVETL